ncbi:MAG: hypothetical protein M1371_02595 [Actinobacteria bacterium]|nr:hypothetical protein [Actinomycetota bacterium]
MKEKSIVGDLIDFRGLVYSPINENGVIFLFGKAIEDLNMYVEEIKPGFPDCIARRFVGKGWEKISIEFEYKSSQFNEHHHDVNKCNMIVCWEHDWLECPIEVTELREVIKSLPNKPIQRPDIVSKKGEPSPGSHLTSLPEKLQKLFERLDETISGISDEIWRKVTIKGFTYYSPERVFIYLDLHKNNLCLTVFTRGERLDGVQPCEYEKGGAKWGRAYIANDKNLEKVIPAIKRSYELIKRALKANEQTGWYADLEEESEESTLEEINPTLIKEKQEN